MKIVNFCILLFFISSCTSSEIQKQEEVKDILQRSIGKDNLKYFSIQLEKDTSKLDKYSLKKYVK
ncbi:MAG: hypothetical protein VYD71_01990 [Bacteroidota bacterium]|nr:hypothetical protein [Bacteroidota bacterium]